MGLTAGESDKKFITVVGVRRIGSIIAKNAGRAFKRDKIV